MLALLLAASMSLPEMQQRLHDERSAAQKLEGREATVLGRLAELERQIEVGERGLRSAELKLKVASGRFDLVEERARSTQAQVDASSAIVGPRLVARYRMGKEGYLRFLLGSRSIADLLRRRRLFNALLESDLDALAVLRFHADGAKAARDELAVAHAELQQTAAAETERRRALDEMVAEQRQLLASVQQQKGLHDQAVRELEDAARAVASRLGEIDRGPAMSAARTGAAGSIRRSRGKLPFPIDRGNIEVRFGRAVDPRFGTVTLQNGIDVRAPAGTPVHAVWDGKVVHAGWFRGFGNLIIVDHGSGIYSLMAHLDRLQRAMGDLVRVGDEVGTVGESGSLKGPYLYFELRDRQRPLDPQRWLSRMRKAPALLAGAKGAGAR
jgi:septal ring factor EnvC (AmiA/AmiB activator)